MAVEVIKILIIEDNPLDAELMIASLKAEKYQPVWQRVDNEPEYLNALNSSVDLILSNWRLPDFSGLRALHVMREKGFDIPFIIVSGSIGEEAAINALRHGTYDYVLKDHLNRLGQAVKHALEEKQMRKGQENAKRLLVESELKFRTIFEKSTTGYSLTAPDGRLLEVNPWFANMLGFSVEELMQETYLHITHPEDLAESKEVIRSVLAGEKNNCVFEKRYIHRDGHIVWALVSTTLLRDDHSNPVYFITSIQDISERKQVEVILRESEARFRSLFEHSPVAYQSLNADGEIIDVNDQLCELLGYSRDELIGKTSGEFWTPETKASFPKTFAKFVADGRTSGDCELVKKNGVQIIVQIDGRIQRDSSGKFVRTHCILFNITEMRRTEEALRKSETNLKKAQKVANVGSWAWHVPTNRLEWSDQMYNIFGIDKASFTGNLPDVIVQAIHPDDQQAVEAANEAAAKKGRPTPLEYRIVWKDGTIRTVWAEAGELVYDSAGNAETLTGIVQDITERKNNEAVLRMQSTALQSAANAIMITGRDGTIEWVNRAFEELTGYTAQEAIGKNPRILKSGVQDVSFYQNLWGTILSGKVWQNELVNKRKDGSLYTEEETITPIIGPNGEIEHFIGIKLDITERKQAEEALKEEQFLTRTLMDTIPDTIYFKDIQGHFIRINQAQAQKLGVSDTEQVLGKTDFDFFAPEHAQAALKDEEQIIRTGLPLINFEEMLNYPDRPAEWVSATKFPLRDLNGQIVGTFGISRDISNLKQAEARLLFQSEELQKRNSELARLYRISESLISPKPFDLHGLAQAIVDTVIREFGVSNCSLYLIQKNSNDLSRLAYGGEISEKYLETQLTLDGPGLISLAIRTRQVVNAPDVSAQMDYFSGWDNARSELVIPFYLNDAIIGVIDVQSDQLAKFTSEEEKVLQTFANQAAIVLENTNLSVETNLQVQRLNSLRVIDGAINASLDLKLTTSVLLEQIKNQLHVDAVDILLFNPFAKSLQYVNGLGFTTASLQRTDLRLGQGLAGRAASERKVVHVSDLSMGDEFFKNSPAMKEENFVEYYGVPLISKGSIKGFLEIFHRSRLKEDPSWLSFMGTLAGQAAIAIDNIRMFEDLQKSNEELTLAYDATIEGWSRALDLRDQETEGHTRRVTDITMRLAKVIGIQGEELVQIWRGALLHDIGKMGISDNILLKPEALTDEEWITMHKHPVYAFDLLSPVSFLKLALDIPYCHHEKWDGSGYPRGLKGEQIPLSARLFAVADVWDALTSDRPYRKAWSESQAIEYIREQAGKQFDPQAVELFMNNYLFEESSMVKPTILIVDDEESVTRSLARSLKDHFTILTANSGEDALRIAERSDLAVVLTDQRMPGMSGVELLERIRTLKPKSVGILISGYSDVVALTTALNLTNVRGFIPKPWDLDSLRSKLNEAVAQYREMLRGFTNQE